MKAKKIYILLVVITISFFGCNEYLSELPDNRTVIDSPEKISSLITGAYPDGNYMFMAELMSDNAGEKFFSGEDQLDQEVYQWADTNLEDLDSPVFYWNSCYEAIAQANQALASIEELENEFNLDAQKGEALLARAYAHFMLVNFWGKAYNPNTASSDLGVPYVLEPETTLIQRYERNTVEEVYNLIETDILEGLELVGNDYDEPRFHFTKDAGNAFAVRFYLYKGDWDKVIEYANNVINAPLSEIRDDVSYRNLSFDEIARTYPSTTERSNLLIVSTFTLWSRKYAGSRFGMNQDVFSELFTSGNPYGKGWAYRVFGTDLFFNLPKFEEFFKVTNQSAGTGLPFVGIVLFDKDEVLLNRAEAYAMKNDTEKALEDLSNFLQLKTTNFNPATDVLSINRLAFFYPPVLDEFTPYYDLTALQAVFVKSISALRRREYFHEGLRWFDIKRFNLEINRTFNGLPVTLEKEDLRKQLQIPKTAQNFGVVANPR
jgi:tetratricopeptide (TPR) repeat protein